MVVSERIRISILISSQITSSKFKHGGGRGRDGGKRLSSVVGLRSTADLDPAEICTHVTSARPK